MAIHLLAHDEVCGVDVVHLLADTLQPVLQPQRRLPEVSLRHAVHHVDCLALRVWHYFGVAVDVGDLLHFDFQSFSACRTKKESER